MSADHSPSQSPTHTAQSGDAADTAAGKSHITEEIQLAGGLTGHLAMLKENRSPNLTLLDALVADPDSGIESKQASACSMQAAE